MYLRPEALALFSFQIVKGSYTETKVAWSAVLKLFKENGGEKGDQDDIHTNLCLQSEWRSSLGTSVF